MKYCKSLIIWIVILFLNLAYGKNFKETIKDREFQDKYFNEFGIEHRNSMAIKSIMIHPENREKLLGKVTYQRPNLPETYITPEGHFKIHFTTSGDDAIDNTITNDKNVPDYAYEAGLAAEKAYHLLIDVVGFSSPPNDGIDGNEIDIYIIDWNGSYYAMTYPENEVNETSRRYDYTSFLEVDNNYDENSYTTHGIDALHVTVAHEFFHMVQLGYNWFPSNNLAGVSSGDQYFLEWSSTWFEEFCYPEVDDYVQYTGWFLESPLKSIWSNSYWYSHGIFLRYLTDRYGENLLLKIWEKIKTKSAFIAMSEVVENETNISLLEHWQDFYSLCYFTGKRYNSEFSLSEDAEQFPLLTFSTGNKYTYNNPTYISSTAQPFSTIPVMVDFSENQYIGLEKNEVYKDTLLIKSLLNRDAISPQIKELSLQYGANIGLTQNSDTLILFITNSSQQLPAMFFSMKLKNNPLPWIPIELVSVFPNPTKSSQISLNINLDDRTDWLKISIFDLIGEEIFKKKYLNHNPNFTREIVFNNGKYLSSGIYLLRIETETEHIYAKFTLIK